MESLSLVILFLVSFPEASLVAMIGLSMLGIRPTLGQVLFFGLIQAILGVFTRLLPFPFGFHTLLQFITFSALIFFVMTIPYRLSLLVALIGFIINGLVQAMVVPLLFSITGLSFSEVFNGDWLRVMFSTPVAVVLVLLILLIRKFDDKISKYRDLIIKPESSDRHKSGESFPLVGLFLVQSLLIVILLISSYTAAGGTIYPLHKSSIGFSTLFISVILILSGVMLISIKRVISLIQNETKTRAELDSLRRVEELVNTIRAQRHDFTNHLQVSYGLLDVGAYDEAKEYIAKNVSGITKTLDLVKTDNLAVTALLYSKTGLAEAKSINFNVKVVNSLNPLHIDSRDINTIIGNIIDNAFEAVVDLPAEKRYVEASLLKDAEWFSIEIKNAGPPIDQALLQHIFSPGVSTRGEGRGMGLYSVKKLVDLYKGTICAINSDSYVVFRVRIPLNN